MLSHSQKSKLFAIILSSSLVLLALPAVAAAQWWPPYGYGPYGPYGPYGRYPYGYDQTTSMRLEVKPREAEVYVDGYRAGIVDDFDGVFQRLRVRPGGHEIVLYLDGYKTVTQNVYLPPASERSLKLTMVPLAAGEAADPRPTPHAPPSELEQPAPMTRQRPRPLPQPAGPPAAPAPAPAQASYGSLSIRLVPVNADVTVDGERWRSTNALEPLVIELAEGKHHVEAQKPGYEKFSAEVDIKSGETKELNISLKRGG